MGRPKGSKNKLKDKPKVKDKVVVDMSGRTGYGGGSGGGGAPMPIPVLEGVALFKALKDGGFPQGGVGNWIDLDNERLYVPHPSEVYQMFIADPDGWELMTAAMARVWLDLRK